MRNGVVDIFGAENVRYGAEEFFAIGDGIFRNVRITVGAKKKQGPSIFFRR